MRILLIEDEERIAGFVQRGLAESGYSVEWAATGSNGMEAVQQIDFDLIILDLMLPDADGLELLEKIRARPISPPILILSAKGRLEDRHDLAGAPASRASIACPAKSRLSARSRRSQARA